MPNVERYQREIEKFRGLIRPSSVPPFDLFTKNIPSEIARLDNVTEEAIDQYAFLIPYKEIIIKSRDLRLTHVVDIYARAVEDTNFWRENFDNPLFLMDGLLKSAQRGAITSEVQAFHHVHEMLDNIGWFLNTCRIDEQKPLSRENFRFHNDTLITDLYHVYEIASGVYMTRGPVIERQEDEAARESLKLGNFDPATVHLSEEEKSLFEPFETLGKRFDEFRITFESEIAKAAQTTPVFMDIQDNLATVSPNGVLLLWLAEGKPGTNRVLKHLDTIINNWMTIIKHYLGPDENRDTFIPNTPEYIFAIYSIFDDALGLYYQLDESLQ